MNYRKKPVVIQAEQFFSNEYQSSDFLKFVIRDKSNIGAYWFGKTAKDGRYFIETLEGYMQVNEGDYIIKGIVGEFYPCKPEIFEKTYEKID